MESVPQETAKSPPLNRCGGTEIPVSGGQTWSGGRGASELRLDHRKGLSNEKPPAVVRIRSAAVRFMPRAVWSRKHCRVVEQGLTTSASGIAHVQLQAGTAIPIMPDPSTYACLRWGRCPLVSRPRRSLPFSIHNLSFYRFPVPASLARSSGDSPSRAAASDYRSPFREHNHRPVGQCAGGAALRRAGRRWARRTIFVY
jgi:hypothetical protein